MNYGSIERSSTESERNSERHEHRRDMLLDYRADSSEDFSVASSVAESLVRASFRFSGDPCAVRDHGGTATVYSETINISKNLLGSGIFSLSGGIALYANSPKAMVSASLWIVLLGAMFGFFCILIAKVCRLTGSATYRESWEATMGSRGALLVAIVQTLLAAQGDIAYATVLSQTLKSLLETIGIFWDRITCLLVVTVVALLPLCLMKDIDHLAPFSALGVASVFVLLVAMIVRCFDGSYQVGGRFFDADAPPIFGNEVHPLSSSALPYVCMVFQAWVMHYNAPRFYTELKDATIPRFSQAVTYSFSLSALLYITIAATGFWTFGTSSSSYILNNYSPQDPLATASRIAVAFSTLLTYVLAFFGVRDGCLGILEVPDHLQTSTNLNLFTLFLLSVLTIFAVFFDDLGLINAVGGGCLATLICIIFPALMYREAIKSLPTRLGRQEVEVRIAMVLMAVGTFLGVVGVYVSVRDAK